MLPNVAVEFDETVFSEVWARANLTFREAFEEIIKFIEADTNSSYRISIGTDSHVGNGTLFVTCIHVHRIGKGLSDFSQKSDVKAYKEFTGENLHGNMYEPPAGIFV